MDISGYACRAVSSSMPMGYASSLHMTCACHTLRAANGQNEIWDQFGVYFVESGGIGDLLSYAQDFVCFE